VSRSSRIELVLGAERPGTAVVTVDGRDARPLSPGETVEVSDAHAPLRVVSVSGRSYYDQLRLRLGWTGRPVYRGPDAEPAGPLLPDARPAPLGRAAKAARLARRARRERP